MFSLTFFATKYYNNKKKKFQALKLSRNFKINFPLKQTKIIEAKKDSLSIPPSQFLNPKNSLSFLYKPLICFHSHHRSPKNLSSLLRSTSSKSTSLTNSQTSVHHQNQPLTHKSPNPITPKSIVVTTMSYAKAYADITFLIPSVSTTKSIIHCFAQPLTVIK